MHVERHPAAAAPHRNFVGLRAAAWLCLLVLLCTAARLWQITSDSMLPGAAPTESRGPARGQPSDPTAVSIQCVRSVDIDIYTAALMDRQQLRNFEASMCR